jgi:hypothetical protein
VITRDFRADVYARVTADSMRRSLAKLDKVLAGP